MLLIILLLGVVTVSASVVFEDCGSAYDLRAVHIAGCNRRLPCYVTLGDEIPVDIEFYADFASEVLDQDVVININLINLNAEVTPDRCATENCPVTTNASTSFTSVMSVPPRMALNQRGYLRWRVYNENGRLVLCYSVLVQTQSPLQKMLRQTLTDMATYAIHDVTNNIDPATSNVNMTQNYLKDLIDHYYEKNRVVDLTK